MSNDVIPTYNGSNALFRISDGRKYLNGEIRRIRPPFSSMSYMTPRINAYKKARLPYSEPFSARLDMDASNADKATNSEPIRNIDNVNNNVCDVMLSVVFSEATAIREKTIYSMQNKNR